MSNILDQANRVIVTLIVQSLVTILLLGISFRINGRSVGWILAILHAFYYGLRRTKSTSQGGTWITVFFWIGVLAYWIISSTTIQWHP